MSDQLAINTSGRAGANGFPAPPEEATSSGVRARKRRSYSCQSKLCAPGFSNTTGICPMCGREGTPR